MKKVEKKKPELIQANFTNPLSKYLNDKKCEK